MEELEVIINNTYKGQRLHYAGLVERVESRNGDLELRKISQSSRYVPLSWDGGILIFVIITAPSIVQKNRFLRMNVDIVIISEDPDDYERLASRMPSYDYELLTINFDSQSVYYRYMKDIPDKPFVGYARAISTVIDSNGLKPC